ncbi:MAG: caspase family protein, partial [Geminicoccaceae bacterium]|nr:caspase family protein [Geminicoccaceae bacterium]
GSIRTLILFAGLVLLAPVNVYAGQRVALVMGNGAYSHAGKLPNPPNDARSVARSLRAIGFTVFSGIDLDLDSMRGLSRDFARSLDGADTGLIFYAGHGLQVNGENYLLPVDAELAHESDLAYETISLGDLMRQLEAPDRASVLILDACRNNPLGRSFQRRSRNATVGNGLARLSAGTGSMIAFATAPGDVALDGDGQHSPFTTALIRHLATPGLEINQLMTRVRADVYASTDGDQLPWTNSALLGELYLVPGDGSAVPLAAPAPAAASAAGPVTMLPQEAAQARPATMPPPSARSEPPPFTMVACKARSGAAWAGERFLTFQQCKDIGGDWRLLQ